MVNKHSLIRTIYLYLFALIGLVLLVIGTVNFINMALKAYIFTQAEEQEKIYDERPPVPYQLEKVANLAKDDGESKDLTDDEISSIRNWLIEYEEWEKTNEDFDPIVSRRHREASTNLSMIIVGLPLFLYHWTVIRRETNRRKEKV